MIDAIPVIAIVPARGGSKGLPGKNLKRVGGTSLIGRAIQAAKASPLVDRVLISTDCPEIAAEARRHGGEVPFLRPAELASDTATTAAVVGHLIGTLAIATGYLVLLQPTSPLRTTADIDACVALCRRARAPAAVSVTEVDTSPYWMFHVGPDARLAPVVGGAARPTRRQDAPPAFALNGAVYVVDVAGFRAAPDFVPPGTVAYAMPAARAIDIDTADDLARARALLRARQAA